MVKDLRFISGVSLLSVFYIFVCFGINTFAMPACYALLVPEDRENSVLSTMAINIRLSLSLY